MKKQFILLAIVCMSETTFSQSKNYTMSTDKIKNVETVSKMYESMSAKDIKKWISNWAEDGVQYLPYSPDGFPKSVEGKQKLEEIYTNLLAGYGELKYTHIDIEAMDNPNKVLVRWGVDIELKGKTERYQNELIGIFEFENGKVKNFTEYFNPVQFMNAIGHDNKTATIKARNIQNAKNFLLFLEEKDINKWMELWADDGVNYYPYHSGMFPEKMVGKQQIYANWKAVPQVFISLNFPIHEIYADETGSIITVRFDSHNIKADQGHYDNTYVCIFKFNEQGKIREYYEYFNPIVTGVSYGMLKVERIDQ